MRMVEIALGVVIVGLWGSIAACGDRIVVSSYVAPLGVFPAPVYVAPAPVMVSYPLAPVTTVYSPGYVAPIGYAYQTPMVSAYPVAPVYAAPVLAPTYVSERVAVHPFSASYRVREYNPYGPDYVEKVRVTPWGVRVRGGLR